MDAVRTVVFPNDLLLRCDLEQFHAFGCVIACNDRVSIGESLHTACVIDDAADLVVGDLPDNVALTVDFDHAVAVRASDNRRA